MYQQGSQAPGLDQRLSELQAQIDQLTSSLNVWFQTQARMQPAEHRLAQLTDRCGEIINQWTAVGTRHEQVVGELETRVNELTALQTRIQHDASGRIHDLEQVVEHEWSALRHIHEEPVRELRTQAASLTDVCLAAANATQRGLERSEARLALLESDLHREMRELSREVQQAVAELRSRPVRQPDSVTDGVSPWPLEGVMRLHGRFRESADASGGALALQTPGELGTAATAVVDQLPVVPHVLSDRINSLERRARRNWRLGLLVLTLGVAGAGALIWRLERQVGAAAARVSEAEHQAQIATDEANRRIAAVRDDAAHQVATANETALKAQTISDVLAAPDLVRYNLVGGNEGARFSAQALWSRSRGFVFSASRLPQPAAGSTYQIWLSTAGQPVSGGVFVPDASGRITLATDTPPRVPRPVLNVFVTIEPRGGRQTPSGATLLTRPSPPPTP
jgi:Anti-sigma-K factor rskA